MGEEGLDMHARVERRHLQGYFRPTNQHKVFLSFPFLVVGNSQEKEGVQALPDLLPYRTISPGTTFRIKEKEASPNCAALRRERGLPGPPVNRHLLSMPVWRNERHLHVPVGW